jgi:uncharacterized protein (TIGR02996 family)
VEPLEQLIVARPDDAETWLVYADWLSTRGDPRGELIALQLRGEQATGDGERRALREAAEMCIVVHGLAPRIPEGRTIERAWRRGFVDRLALGWAVDPTSAELAAGTARGPWDDAPEQVAATIEHPALRFVRELALGPATSAEIAGALAAAELPLLERLELQVIDWPELEDVVEAIAARPWPRLSSLSLGVARYRTLMHAGLFSEAFERGPLVAHDDVRRLAAATPALRTLELAGCRLFAGLRHPTLQRLALVGDPVDGCVWNHYDAAPVALPSVEHLEVTSVDDDYRYFHVASLQIPPAQLPALRRITFRGNYELDDDRRSLFGWLASAPILPQLTELSIPELDHDLDLVDELGARFHHLRALHVEEIYVHEEDELKSVFEARCRRALPNLILGS